VAVSDLFGVRPQGDRPRIRLDGRDVRGDERDRLCHQEGPDPIGLVLASLVNWFAKSQVLDYIISYVGVFIFLGLTAYDTQKLKEYAWRTEGDPRMASRMAIVGSLALYLDFLNIFLFLLRIFGDRR
jgi:hypothetical protein